MKEGFWTRNVQNVYVPSQNDSTNLMIVAKFGGTSVGTSKRIKNLTSIIQKQLDKNPVVVVSAVSGITDLLLSLENASTSARKKILAEIGAKHETIASELSLNNNFFDYIQKRISSIQKSLQKKSLNRADIDEIISNGEILSSYIIAEAFQKMGISAQQIIATDLIVTNDHFGSAEFIPDKTREKVQKVIKPILKQKIIPVVTGFIGATVSGKTTILGRGGSDYSASIIGFALRAEEIQIWTDVNGIYTADPRIVKNAKLISTISYREASELAFFGAKVLHPRTIRPAIAAEIPVRVLNSFEPKNSGTRIVKDSKPKNHVTALSFKRHVTLVNLYSADMLFQKGFLVKVFEIFALHNISIDLVSVSEVSVSVTLENVDNLEKAIAELSIVANVSVNKNVGMVSVVGNNIVSANHITQKIFEILDRAKVVIKMISLGAVDINMSIVIESLEVEKVVQLLHDKILLKD